MAATGKQSGLSFARVVSGGNFSQQQEDLDQQSVPDETPIFTTDIQSSLAQVDLQIDDRSNTNESVQTQTGDSSDWPSLNETSIPTNQKDDDDIHSKNKKPLCPDADQDNNALTVNVEDTDENSQACYYSIMNYIS